MLKFVGSIIVLLMLTIRPVSPGRFDNIYVSVVVQSDTHADRIRSYVNRSLRTLGDVVILDSETAYTPRHTFRILHISLPKHSGHLISVAVTESIFLPSDWKTQFDELTDS